MDETSARGSSPIVRTPRKKVRWYEAGAFTIPALLVYVAFVFVPIGFGIILSIRDGSRLNPVGDNFIGFTNYTAIFDRTPGILGAPVFWDAVRNNFLIAIMSLLIQGPLAILIALLLNRKMRGSWLIRTLIFVPWVVSEVITGVMFQMLVAPNGAVASAFNGMALSLPNWLGGSTGVTTRMVSGESVQMCADGFLCALSDVQWLAGGREGGLGSWTFWFIMLVLTWKYLGLAIILFLAGMSGIPEELTEAAAIDGAGWWQIQRKVTLPLLGPTIRIWAFLSIIGSFQLFDMVWILTRQSPTTVGMDTMATYMVVQQNAGRVGYGSAVAGGLFAVSPALALSCSKVILEG
ncbi:MAG: sugar ABC transporter permease, partial [Promicromonosporaceae bacterium]|nr:sugar ABC transporter permease [Promicromonosporaceae bacterium]